MLDAYALAQLTRMLPGTTIRIELQPNGYIVAEITGPGLDAAHYATAPTAQFSCLQEPSMFPQVLAETLTLARASQWRTVDAVNTAKTERA